jgi:hypothetical protein
MLSDLGLIRLHNLSLQFLEADPQPALGCDQPRLMTRHPLWNQQRKDYDSILVPNTLILSI